MNLVLPKVSHFDLIFIIGIALLASIMAGVTVYWPLLFIPMLTVHSWLFGYEHLWATYTKLLVHPDDRKRHGQLIFFVPLLVLLVLFYLAQTLGLGGLYVLYFFGQFFHTVRQSWGITQTYRRQAGGLIWDSTRLSEITLWSVPIWGILNRCAQRPNEFLFQEFWLPSVSQILVNLVGFLSCILWMYWFYTRFTAYRRGELAMGHSLYMISHLLIFFSGYLLIEELCSGWLLVNVWHNVQYIAFVWMYNRNRFSSGLDSKSRVLSWISQRGTKHIAAYFLVTLTFALPVYYLLPELGFTLDSFLKDSMVPTAVVLAMTLTFHHYITDAIIWKQRNNPDLRYGFLTKND
ncbi:hypothetical protein [Leptospira harrisiae]|uniref:Uncharacterized protein n=1 Tax=Leptospira harrisiae TaxID=2023189 RepID=A0A2N0AL07_9LEPT|nr:hypothetical protein [Leptospira harrisiae]PJZ84901.1 hypothetical protein CH364_01070 [Leptospira harrisiae]PKA08404.1 hypothetical protein CH366_01070 [Leptospira harrisiae]